MSRNGWGRGTVLALLLAGPGCCSWCDRWCSPRQVSYAQPAVAPVCYQAPVCCCPAPAGTPVPANYGGTWVPAQPGVNPQNCCR